MAKAKKVLFTLIVGVLGLLLALAGLNLIALTQTLQFYVGVALLVISLLYYLMS